MNKDIKINTHGLITKGKYTGWYIYVEDDSNDGGGYYILFKKALENNTEGYDHWMENFEDVKNCFEVEQWEVKWLD